MSEITERLQAFGERLAEDGYPSALVEQAVTRMDAMENVIVEQHERIAELESALQRIREGAPTIGEDVSFAIAKAALKEQDDA